MPSLRSLSQSTSPQERAVLVCDQNSPSEDKFQHNTDLPKRSETNKIKIDTECWIRSYCRSSLDSFDRSNGKYRLSRLSNAGRNYFSKVNLKKRLAGVTCFHIKQHSSHLDESISKPSMRSYTSTDSPLDKTYLSEAYDEKHDPKFGIRINVKPCSYDALNSLSPTSTFTENDILRPVRSIRKKSKPRKVTTYYSSKSVNTRKPRAEVYYTVPRGKKNSSEQCSFRGYSGDKKAVGRHLEWLKFLA